MITTFKGLQTQVLRYLNEEGNTSTTLALTRDYLNQAHQERLTQYPWPFMLQDSSITTVSGVQTYSLHPEFHRPLYFKNGTTRRLLTEVPMRQLEPDGYDWDTQTNVDAFCLWGRSPVKKQPVVPSVITLVSGHSSDSGTTYAVVVRGLTTDGEILAEVIEPSGTTPVSTTTTFASIVGITKTGQSNGTYTFTDSGATVLLSLREAEMGKSYQQIFLLGDPTSTPTIPYRFYRQPLILFNDYDIPEIPPPHAQILVWDTLLMFAAYNSEISARDRDFWQGRQKQLETNLDQAFQEGQSLNAAPRFIRSFDDDWTRFYV